MKLMVVKNRLISESLNLSGICELTKGTTGFVASINATFFPQCRVVYFSNHGEVLRREYKLCFKTVLGIITFIALRSQKKLLKSIYFCAG